MRTLTNPRRAPMSDLLARVGSAPISWGVCEAPGWGQQLPVDRVLGEARDLGIAAVEQGALGWLPTDPPAQRAKLDDYGMTLLGGFVPLVLHDPARRDEMMAHAEQVAANMAACQGTFFVTAIVGDQHDWFRPAMDDAAWAELFANLDGVEQICTRHGLVQAVHPHVDTLIQTASEFQRFLDISRVRFCFDTGHLTLGGADAVTVACNHRDRIAVVHLKDVDHAAAARLASGELGLMAATQAGLFPPLGEGMIDLAGVIDALEGGGYDGWYVIETDVALTDGEPPAGEGPVLGVARSLDYLRSLEREFAH